MIERYALPPMSELWSEEATYRRWLDVELAVVEVAAQLGRIPPKAAQAIREHARVDMKRAKEIEAEIGHDVLAFVRALEESIGPEGRFIHQGLTSYDVVDTALSLALRDGLDILTGELDRLLNVVKGRAREHQYTVMVGRTHGMHAEPVTFGLKLLLWYAELGRDRARLERAREAVSVGKISGSVGTYAHVDSEVERRVCEKLGLQPASISSQFLPRDQHAQVLTTLAIAAGTLEKMATEIRNLHRTEIAEVREGRPHGSSSMPHKQNPSTCETISGLARVVRANALAALENMSVWHEQDLSRSSVERIIIPDSFLALHYMLRKMGDVMESLQIHPERMRQNLELTRGAVFSQAVLLELIDRGMSRREAHELLRTKTLESERTERHLKDLLAEDERITAHLDAAELDRLFDVGYHTRHVEAIFARFFPDTES